MDRYELNGVPVGLNDMPIVSRIAYGHFSTMQVRGGAVRGLGLHLERLRTSSRDLFGTEVDPATVRAYLRHALEGVDAASARINVFPRTMDWMARSRDPIPLDLLVTVSSPRMPPSGAPRVKSVRFERSLPHIKHIGIGLALLEHGRPAMAAGWDDVLFVDGEGRIEEGSVWNVGFFDGSRVVWPSAPALPGITLQLVQKGLEAKGIPSETREVRLEALSSFRAAFLTSTVSIAQSIGCIDDTVFASDGELIAQLVACYESNPLEPV
ncbi:aminotransferase class IV [Pendulispora albinea]|uniref:Aminotransferase class IV n=1 Tax=Pendulispora albinea TaxID=2741071 RepID=A0ABZ2LW93_9BACT